MIARVAVLIGLGDRDLALLDAVAALAPRAGIEALWLVHVKERSQLIPGLTAPPPAPAPALLADRVERARAQLPGVRVEAVYAEGRAPEVLTQLADRETLDLVVLGRAPADRSRAVWGAQGLRILRTADCPVLVVPNGTTVKLGRGRVGMDFSANALEALRLMVGLCDEVRALAIVDSSDEAVDANDEAPLGAAARKLYAELAAPVIAPASLPPLDVVAASSPADALLAAAEGCDLLAIGSRGLTPIAAVLLGSTAERLGGRCKQPLLVVRRRGEHRGLFGGLLRG